MLARPERYEAALVGLGVVLPAETSALPPELLDALGFLVEETVNRLAPACL
jgi:hypothetical protein